MSYSDVTAWNFVKFYMMEHMLKLYWRSIVLATGEVEKENIETIFSLFFVKIVASSYNFFIFVMK